ncbi:hypothetical protein PV10_00875 [Exophiala mesophila]|uniref:Uncharacterized protein n=1 Tax=Exophiala mesophila TaxID=212818 RepID=A0A0D1X5N8_EXOME|nr:uncharacterized protein PV10_00875 [Exophiala mesophila]KIV97080.1 hypothetical protein PV10_00875 [Exophiala mesophila]
MDERLIGLRDEKAEILEKSRLDEQQLNNLTYIANQTHRDLVEEGTRWADSTLDWKAIPTEDMNKALRRIEDRGKDILKNIPQAQRGAIVRNRLYQTRRNWRDQTRRRRQKDSTGGEPSTSDNTDEMGQIIQQGGRIR